ncbi:hypothetical protein [Streptomyces murinus]|uniref:hypothetical protein n=1 Tax=Streptomyces murinus TaxID=33900 RepID=UPI003F488FB2
MPLDRPMRDLLGPIAAVALIAQLNPDLPAPSIEFAHVYPDGQEHGMGVRLHLHHPQEGVYERWANLIGSSDPDSHSDAAPTARGSVIRRTFGRYADVLIEAIAVSPVEPRAANHLPPAPKAPAA